MQEPLRRAGEGLGWPHIVPAPSQAPQRAGHGRGAAVQASPVSYIAVEGSVVNLKRNLLSAALASAIVMHAAPLRAQAPEAETAAEERARKRRDGEEPAKLDVIEVSGIRAGIEKALEIKRESTSIVDVVSAEDLGKLPDVSIADSIARLPGLAAQRVAGRASTISI